MIKHDLKGKVKVTINKDDGDKIVLDVKLEKDGKIRY
jgi:hypothetical protein